MSKPKSTAKYTPLPTAPDEAHALLAASSEDESDADEVLPGERAAAAARGGGADSEQEGDTFPPPSDPRFERQPPSAWKRAALLGAIVFLFWLAFQIKGPRAPVVVHANRYSKQYKYRPAASPIVTETLKDGRLRVRGAGPTSTATPVPKVQATAATAAKKKGGKRKGAGKKAKKGTRK
ncbi:hypothetical protein B0H15DRAFT_1020992 [Mycena belliarum]|uniref:Uncharacterized protein n=1 Tax=Mycena belliarum TaxID=1033014 RepID=A0AAD6U7N5_9AGAR|nr:hypothetical protein B0H15DRAFT_1020992 [Mycena belliae]